MLDENLPLGRGEREYLAVLTSELNSCPYCIQHHKEAFLNHEGSIDAKKADFFKKVAKLITREPWKAGQLKKEAHLYNVSEAEYAHAVMVVSYFNMANRMVFAQNVQLEKNFKKTCS